MGVWIGQHPATGSARSGP